MADKIIQGETFSNKISKGFAKGGSESLSGKDITPLIKTVPSGSNVITFDQGNESNYYTEFNKEDAVLRVSFSINDPYLPYKSARFFIQGESQTTISILGGIFDQDNGSSLLLVNIPLIGQSLQSLSAALQKYSNLSAQVLNGNESFNSLYLSESPIIDGTEKWVYFFAKKEYSSLSNQSNNLREDVKFYYTSIEPDIAQLNPSQSLGGYVSPTAVFETATLSNSISFYDSTFKASSDVLSSYEIVQIQDEIIKLSGWEDNVAKISERHAFDTPLRFHPKESVISGIQKSTMFDGVFSDSGKQYRCIAIKNTNSEQTAKDVKIFFKLISRNSLSNMRFAIEIPRSEYYSSSASSGDRNFLICYNLIDAFSDDNFKKSSITFTSGLNSGQTRIISSYSSQNGSIFFDENLPYVVASGDEFYIGTSPSQRIRNGITSPLKKDFSNNFPYIISDWYDATFVENGISINVGNRQNGANLGPNEVIYIWLERSISDKNEDFENNRMAISFSYSRI